MGNKSCRVAVRIDEPQRAHRSFVTGRVYFHAPTNKAALSSIKGIHLVFVGQEHVEIPHRGVHHEYSRRVHETEPMSERATKMLVRIEVPIVSFINDSLNPGQYEYPFRWKLPPNLPSSMRCKEKTNGGGQVLGEIRYTLSAKVVTTNRNCNGAEGLAHDSVTLNIQGDAAGLRGQPIPKLESAYPIHSCLLWRKGKIRIGWDANTDVCSPNGVISVNVSGENQSRVAVRALSARLVETVLLRSVSLDDSILERSFSRTVSKHKIPVEDLACWAPHRKPDGLLAAHENQPSRFNLRIPDDVRNSYCGDLIQVSHVLTVTAETPGFCTITSPESSHEIHIASDECGVDHSMDSNAPPPENPNYQSDQYAAAECLPDDWKPVVLDEFVYIPEASAVLVDEDLPPPAGDEGSNATATAPTAADSTAASAPSECSVKKDNDSSSPSSRRPPAMAAPTVPGLQEMVETCPETLSAAMNDSAWATLVQNLSPREFCSVVQRAERHAPTVARTLALTMGSSIKTRHLLACLYALPDSAQRMEVLRQIAPLIPDLSENMSVIEQELSRRELVHFRSALRGSGL